MIRTKLFLVPIFGIVWLLLKFFNFDHVLVYTILVPIVGFLHISKLRVKKFTGLWFYIGVSLIAAIAIALVLFVL